MPDKPCLAIGYTRVSTLEQAQTSTSLEAQQDAIRAYCDEQGHKLEEAFSDVGRSGAKLDDRPDLARLRERLRGGDVCEVVVRNLDRLTRDPGHLKMLLDEIHGAGARLVTIDDKVGDKKGLNSRDDAWFIDIAALFAQMQWDRASISTREGQARRRTQCRVDAAERFGFDKSERQYEPDPAGKGPRTYRVWIENPDEIAVLKRIWALHQVGEGPTGIAEALNAAELPAKRGGLWSPETVRGQIRHLTNPELQECYRTVLTPDEGE